MSNQQPERNPQERYRGWRAWIRGRWEEFRGRSASTQPPPQPPEPPAQEWLEVTASEAQSQNGSRGSSISVNDNISENNDRNVIHSSGNVVSAANYGMLIQTFDDVENLLEFLLRKLSISRKADYEYYARGTEEGLRRGGCTPGTRLSVIQAILEWARDASSNCQPIFWLSGEGGAGKTTITFTIIKELGTSTLQATILGGSFFCSRHSPETRTASAIVPTIAYRLAANSPAFRAALKNHGDFKKVDHDPLAQFEALIVEPWKRCLQQRAVNHEPCLIVSIDAIDELDAPGGTDFLKTLIKVVKEHNLPGLKFFMTSRSEPVLVTLIDSFANKRVYQLEKTSIEETSADIRLYLKANLAKPIVEEEQALVEQVVAEAAGLFIYAATVVDYLKGRSAARQQDRLTRLLAQPSHESSRLIGATAKLDHLYRHILEMSLVDPSDQEDSVIPAQCLALLHTFLCTNERTSMSVAVELLNQTMAETIPPVDTTEADDLVRRLRAVLCIQDGQVLWFHNSFPEFIFDQERSGAFYCLQHEHHRLLVNGCFGIMRQELRFNIGDISTSYQLDRDNADLSNAVNNNILPPLRYACRSWGAHLAATAAKSPETICDILSDFLQLRVLFWIEAMNLLGCRGHCAAMLGNAQNWVAKLEDSLSLQGDLDDAAAFALHFSSDGAALSTPHLYMSSLPTFPRRSELLSRWKQRFSGIPGFTSSRSTIDGGLVSSTMMESSVNPVATSQDGARITVGLQDGVVRIRGPAAGDEFKAPEGHAQGMSSVVFSPDGKHVVSGLDDTSVRVWDASTGKQLASLQGHTGGVLSVAYSPDNKHIVSASGDKSVRIWDALTGRQLVLLKGHTEWVCSVAYSSDGKHIASGSHDRSVRVWDASTHKQVALLKGHTDNVTSVACSPDCRHIVSGSKDKSVRVWDASTGKQLALLKGHKNDVNSVAYSPDGRRIVSGSYDASVRIWDASTGRQQASLKGHTGWVFSVACCPDGKHIVSGSQDKSVRVWDAATGKQLTSLEGHTGPVSSVAYSPNGKHIVSGSNDRSVRVWSPLAKHSEIQYLREKVGGVPTGWLLSPIDPSQYLMFVPLSENLPDATNILTIPSSAVAHIDLSKAKLGDSWTACYSPDA